MQCVYCEVRTRLWGEGRVSAVGIATRYGLDGTGIESRWGTRFSAPVQNGPVAHPASCTMGTGSFLGVKRPGRGADLPPPHKRRGHERVELYLYSPSGPQWPVIGRTLPFTHQRRPSHTWPQIRRLSAGLSPRRPGFDPGSVNAKFCGGTSGTGQVLF